MKNTLVSLEKRLEWNIPDPKLLNNEEYNKITQLVKKKIYKLSTELIKN